MRKWIVFGLVLLGLVACTPDEWTNRLPYAGPVEKGIDIMLATDMLYFGWQNLYDVAILVSGDADFAYALQTVKNMGKHVEVAYFESGVSKDLLNMADNRHLLDRNFFRDLWVRKRRSRYGNHYPGSSPDQIHTPYGTEHRSTSWYLK